MMGDPREGEPVEAPWTGAIPFGAGLPSIIRIPVPGYNGLAIEFWPHKSYTGVSTSTVFIRDTGGRRELRLDYHLNPRTNTVDYHWNQTRVFKDFGIQDHTPAGKAGEFLYKFSKAYRYAGRVLLVVGTAMDIYSVVTASNPLRRSTIVLSSWAMAWAGAESAGAVGAAGGSFVPGVGTLAGGIVFAILGGIGGYWAGSKIGAVIYDWAADTQFLPLPETPVDQR